MIRSIAAGVVLVLMTACDKPGVPAEAKELAAVLSGEAKSGAATHPLCKLFSPAEASAYAGKKLKAGVNAAMGTGCQWADFKDDDNAFVLVQVMPTKDAGGTPSGAPGFRKLPDMGKGAYVAADFGGWTVGAHQSNDFVAVIVTGPKASEETAIALMQETLKRRQ